MAKIIAYPNATSISTEDCLLGTQYTSGGTNQTNPTKNFPIGSVVATGIGYTAYTALLSQIGIAAPVDTIVKNNTGVTYTWARSATGVYTITASSNIFDATKTLVFGNIGKRSKDDYFRWEVTSNVEITITTFDNAGNPSDDVFETGSFEIRIYS